MQWALGRTNAVDGDGDKLEINISGAKEKKPKKIMQIFISSSGQSMVQSANPIVRLYTK